MNDFEYCGGTNANTVRILEMRLSNLHNSIIAVEDQLNDKEINTIKAATQIAFLREGIRTTRIALMALYADILNAEEPV
jgi:hypothetical protein